MLFPSLGYELEAFCCGKQVPTLLRLLRLETKHQCFGLTVYDKGAPNWLSVGISPYEKRVYHDCELVRNPISSGRQLLFFPRREPRAFSDLGLFGRARLLRPRLQSEGHYQLF